MTWDLSDCQNISKEFLKKELSSKLSRQVFNQPKYFATLLQPAFYCSTLLFSTLPSSPRLYPAFLLLLTKQYFSQFSISLHCSDLHHSNSFQFSCLPCPSLLCFALRCSAIYLTSLPSSVLAVLLGPIRPFPAMFFFLHLSSAPQSSLF